MMFLQYFQFSFTGLLEFLGWCAVLLYTSHMARVFRQKQIDIIGKWKWYFVASGILLTLGIAALALPLRGLRLGLDFKGGTFLERGFYRPVTAEQIRQAVSSVDPSLENALIQQENKPPQIGQTNSPAVLFLIRSQSLTPSQIQSIDLTLRNKFGRTEILQSQTIGPTIGKELQHNAVIAIFIALGLQLIYIAVRFGWNFNYGLAADLALLHDVIMMVGLYSFFGREADSPFLAALLTVIGYSVMDSIVIFDRIRENLKITSRATYQEIVNQSVLQSMTRSINTLMTVLITLFALYFFGGKTLKNFAFALLIGVTSGAYSSIFIASPLLVLWDQWRRTREKRSLTQVSGNGKKSGLTEPMEKTPAEQQPVPISKRTPRRSGKRKR